MKINHIIKKFLPQMGFEPTTILLQHQRTTEACSKAGQIQSTQALISKSY